jgi:CDP-diacylglycerol---serine O-phosphatidyltransferase
MSKRNAPSKPSSQKEHALQQYQETDGHFSLVRFAHLHGTYSIVAVLTPSCIHRNFRLADLVTIMNGFCGSFSIFSSARYLITNDPSYLWAALSFPLGGLMFDFLDGKVARWRKSSSMLGQELDSLADLVSLLREFCLGLKLMRFQISFGVAPGLLAFVVGLRTYLDTVVLTCFICCGLARLARFNATVALVPKDGGGKAKYFEGLPIPSSLVLVGLLSYWTKEGWIHGQEGLPLGVWTLWGSSGGNGDVHVVSVIFGCWAAAMVSKTLRIPKI